jgi:hypothetical protein
MVFYSIGIPTRWPVRVVLRTDNTIARQMLRRFTKELLPNKPEDISHLTTENALPHNLYIS